MWPRSASGWVRRRSRSVSEQLAPAEKLFFRDLGATVQSVQASLARNLLGVSIVNNQAAVIFVQIFDLGTAGAVTLGTTNPDLEISVAASTSAFFSFGPSGLKFRNGIQVASTTTEKGAVTSAAGVQTFWFIQ